MKTEEKTIKDWLNTLKEPYKTKAIKQTNKEILMVEVICLSNALLCMFNWYYSEEGFEYWDNFYESL